MKNVVLIYLYLFCFTALAQQARITGKVIQAQNNIPILNGYVQLVNQNNKITYTDIEGRFDFQFLSPGMYYIVIHSLGFQTIRDTILLKEAEQFQKTYLLEDDAIQIPEIQITARNEVAFTTINSIDFKLRPINTTQDLLRLVPGLFIAQHAGGGKAEQLFLRGFDVDHGTDVAVSVDNMPVNMASHAHGQGYADLHFVIPETVDNIQFNKGCYNANIGDFNTAGAVKFQTKNFLPDNKAKVEMGKFNTYRALVLLNLIPKKDSMEQKHSAYIASEAFYSRGFFESPQHFNRYNIFAKYHGIVSKKTYITASISTFFSKWDASGQIPDRAVDNGSIGWFGSIDNSEGGNTNRTNANIQVTTEAGKLGTWTNQVYWSNYAFSLFSNFTLYKDDPIHGDEIHQYENRNMLGLNSSLKNDYRLFGRTLKTNVGAGYRGDFIDNIGLAHVEKREFLNDVKKGSIHENNINGFADASLLISSRLTLNLGLRYDYFTFLYKSSIDDTSSANRGQGIASPKINIYYKLTQALQLYASGGYGFHSNDARVSVYKTTQSSLPRAKSVDLGTNAKIGNKLFVNMALWYMYLESEYVYVGDDGLLEPSGSTRRMGIDMSFRYQLAKWLFADMDLNLAKPRYINLPRNENYVPLAPPITSTGGLSVKQNKWSASLRYRYLGHRPAVEDNTIVAKGYFIMDAVVNYQLNRFLFGISAENIFNQKWKEAQFATESQLKNETTPVTEIHFTPGTPFYIKGSITVSF
ncbi:TonB-dependent receptor [uncultured Cytophaga sp.]|uniref:TonB-dependent receptor n=1 Tax=uncultured Cytophaga sp. TaxID=160238 RepID=UPI0026156185|nr:TonB-dependent receptor [uncultured Cytophaga sp.]